MKTTLSDGLVWQFDFRKSIAEWSFYVKKKKINFSVRLIGLPNWKYILSLIIMF